MLWYQCKNWRTKLKDEPEFREQIAELVTEDKRILVSLNIPVDTGVRLYGVCPVNEGDDAISPAERAEFWEDIAVAGSLAIRFLNFHEEDPNLVVVVNILKDEKKAIPWNIPISHLNFATPGVIGIIDSKLAEMLAWKEKMEKIISTSISMQTEANASYAKAEEILSNMQEVAKVWGQGVVNVPAIKREDADKLMAFWNDVVFFDPPLPTGAFMAFTKDNVEVKYLTEGAGKVHPSLDGRVTSLGRFMLVFATKPSGGLLGGSRLHMFLYGEKKPNNPTDCFHPHLRYHRDNPAINNLWELYPCWGTYDSGIKEYRKRWDVVTLCNIMKDFLCSCSEHGWYFSPMNIQNVPGYCLCGKSLKTDKLPTRCDICGESFQDQGILTPVPVTPIPRTA